MTMSPEELRELSKSNMKRAWVDTDKYPNETNTKKKVIWLQSEDYDKQVFDPVTN